METDFKKLLVAEEVEDHLLNKIHISPDMCTTFNRWLWGSGSGFNAVPVPKGNPWWYSANHQELCGSVDTHVRGHVNTGESILQ